MGKDGTFYGFTAEEWVSAREHMRSVLVDVARQRGTITYGELAGLVGRGHFSARSSGLMRMLGEVCDMENEPHGILIESLVVRAASGIPGDGYFGYLASRGEDVSDRSAYWDREVARVWEAYAHQS